LKNRPIWKSDTIIEPADRVSGSTSVACWLSVLVNGSRLSYVRLGAAPWTVRLTVVEWVADVPVPVTVTVEVPGAVDVVVEMVRVEPAPAVTDVGLKVAVAPVGRPLAPRLTVWGEPDVTLVEIVVVPLPPADTVMPPGLAAMAKSLGNGPTVSDTDVVWVA
jgi:hypothetical protein